MKLAMRAIPIQAAAINQMLSKSLLQLAELPFAQATRRTEGMKKLLIPHPSEIRSH